MPRLDIYTDGSSSRKSGLCAWAVIGWIIENDNVVGEIRKCGYEKGTNQRAELQAIIQALRLIPEGASARIISDSEYSIKAMTSYRRRWSGNGFKNIDGNTISHFELITEGHRLLDKRQITFQHVRGHQGNPGNESADTLATFTRAVGEGREDGSSIEKYLIMKGTL